MWGLGGIESLVGLAILFIVLAVLGKWVLPSPENAVDLVGRFKRVLSGESEEIVESNYGNSNALETLNEELAEGNIDEEEYERRKELIES